MAGSCPTTASIITGSDPKLIILDMYLPLISGLIVVNNCSLKLLLDTIIPLGSVVSVLRLTSNGSDDITRDKLRPALTVSLVIFMD
jgi:hypothetical protein